MANNPRADRDWLNKIQQRERSGDFAWSLSKIDWDTFSTLTFPDPVPREKIAYGMVWRWCRTLSEVSGVSYNRLLISVRGEYGEQNGRFHFHVLVGGTTARNITTFCHQSVFNWKAISNMGRTDVRPYNRSLAGAEYICKCLGANAYEVGKFNLADSVTLSKSVFKLLEVQRHREELNRRATRDTAVSTLGKNSGKMIPAPV